MVITISPVQLAEAMALGSASAIAAAPAAKLCDRLFAARPPLWALSLACGLCSGLAALVSADAYGAALSAALALTLVLLAAVDLAVLRLPDAITLPLAAAGLLRALVEEDDVGGKLAGAAAGFLAFAVLAEGYRRLRGRSGLGMGDAKLMAAAGAWLGWGVLPQVVLIGCAVSFAALALLVLRRGMRAAQQPFPFGPSLCAAFLIAWLWLRRI